MPKGVFDRKNWKPWNKGLKTVSGPSHPRWTSVQQECKVCGKKYWIRKSHAHTRTTCGRECHKKYRTLFLSGKNCPAWKGGVSQRAKYKGGFTEELKKSVKNRDGNKCVSCGLQKTLQVHHVNFKRDDNRIDNLVTLCASCHIHIEKLEWWKRNNRKK
jgi:hypothetical protein